MFPAMDGVERSVNDALDNLPPAEAERLRPIVAPLPLACSTALPMLRALEQIAYDQALTSADIRDRSLAAQREAGDPTASAGARFREMMDIARRQLDEEGFDRLV
jgi:hypothetical protein